MTQYDFDILLKKYLSGEASKEEEQLIQHWANELLNQSNLSINTEEKESIRKRLWMKIQQNTVGRETKYSFIHFHKPWFAWGAASLVLLGSFLAYFLMNAPKTKKTVEIQVISSTPKDVIELKNASDKDKEIKLEDGSIVVLKPNSSIRYPEHFGRSKREVYLKGEGFFKVKRNRAKPFLVHTGELNTEVLGTSFYIKSYEEASSIEVSVVSGRVSVYEQEQKSKIKDQKNLNGLILTPNQKIIFEKATKKMIPTIIENPIVINPPVSHTSFVFEETPLSDVLEKLKKAYAIDILVQNPAMNKCVLTADLNELSLYKQLDLICRAINSTYEQRGTSIFINGQGCK